MNNYGVVLKRLRVLKKLSVKQAASQLGRSVGWLSEIENGKGYARLKIEEFERIITIYDGESHRSNFPIWIASAIKSKQKAEIAFDGAILKYLREKKGLSLDEVSEKLSYSKRYLSNLENGFKHVNIELRDKLLAVYGYSPSSYRNFNSADKRAGNIPVRYKINILLNQAAPEDLQATFDYIYGYLQQKMIKNEVKA